MVGRSALNGTSVRTQTPDTCVIDQLVHIDSPINEGSAAARTGDGGMLLAHSSQRRFCGA
jgi:hypothetical protein